MKSKTISFPETSAISTTKGIFSYLQGQAGFTNLHEKGIISITTNYQSSSNDPLFLMDKSTSTYWASGDNIDAYLLIDFKKNKVIVEDYWINDYGVDFSQEWKMLGSNDNVRWTLISNEKTSYGQNDRNLYYLRLHSLSLRRFRYIK